MFGAYQRQLEAQADAVEVRALATAAAAAAAARGCRRRCWAPAQAVRTVVRDVETAARTVTATLQRIHGRGADGAYDGRQLRHRHSGAPGSPALAAPGVQWAPSAPRRAQTSPMWRDTSTVCGPLAPPIRPAGKQPRSAIPAVPPTVPPGQPGCPGAPLAAAAAAAATAAAGSDANGGTRRSAATYAACLTGKRPWLARVARRRFQDNWRFAAQQIVTQAALLVYLEQGQLMEPAHLAQLAGVGVAMDLDAPGFSVTLEDFLIGLCSLSSELARYAMNCVIAEDYRRPSQMARFVGDLNAAFRMLNLKNDALRRRYDGMKYDVRRLEEIVYDLSIRGLLPRDAE